VIDAEHYPGSRTFVGRLLRLPLSIVPKTTVVPILQGPLRGKRWIVGSGIHRLWLGSYERAKMNLAAQLTRGGDVVFDVGANVGIYTLLFSDRVGPAGQVIAFEPSPGNVVYLEKHLDLNRASNVRVVGEAVSSSVGQARFNTTSSCAGRIESGGDLQVTTTTIDSFVEATGLVPSLMKIDVEGAEADVLKGANKTLRDIGPQILLATHSKAIHQTCMALLVNHGYTVEEVRAGRTVYEDELLARRPSDAARMKSA
jgi:FkbM family methyltransferase